MALAYARFALGLLIGGIVGLEMAFSHAMYAFLFGDVGLSWSVARSRLFDERPVYFAIVGLVAGAIGGLLWGKVANALLHFCVLAMAGAYLATFATYCCLSNALIVRDGDVTDYLNGEWILIGGIIGGVFGLYNAFRMPREPLSRGSDRSDSTP